MPKDVSLIDDIEDMGSSPASVEDVVNTEPQGESVASEASSASKPEDVTEVDTLSIVRDVAGKKGDTDAASSAEGEAGAADGPATKEEDNENYTDVPFAKHKRFQQLLGRVKTAEVDATRYRNVQTFLEDNDLKAEEAADFLQVAALAKHDPVAAWPRMKPFVTSILRAAGEILSPELEAQVTAGQLTAEQALSVSRANANANSARHGATRTQERVERNAQTEQVDRVMGTIAEWEADRTAKDPNFAAKMPMIQREIAWLHMNEGKPNTPQAVRAQIDKAYKAVNASFRPPAPSTTVRSTRPSIKPVVGGQSKGAIDPKSMTTLDIVKANRRGARA